MKYFGGMTGAILCVDAFESFHSSYPSLSLTPIETCHVELPSRP